jgi:flagellar biosynthesis/type III secretory pathway protein FliH
MNHFMLWHRQPEATLGITTDRRVLRAAEVPALRRAQDLLADLHALQASTQARVDEACADARQAGHREGWAAGQAEAREQLGRALADLARAQEAAREQSQQAIGRLALEVFHKLLGSLPGDEALARLAVQAARELQPARTWRLQVHPHQVPTLRAALQAADPDNRAGLAQAELVADVDLADTDCRLTTEFGTADASLATQVERLAKAWGL